MTSLERAVVSTLRLSDAAANELLTDIQRNIEIARAELIRSGVSEDIVIEEGVLVQSAIIHYCLAEMGDEERQQTARNAFLYEQENLRKS